MVHFLSLLAVPWPLRDVSTSGASMSLTVGTLGPDLLWRWHLTSIGNPIVEIRRSSDRLISTMGFPIPIRCHHYIESGPWSLSCLGKRSTYTSLVLRYDRNTNTWVFFCMENRTIMVIALMPDDVYMLLRTGSSLGNVNEIYNIFVKKMYLKMSAAKIRRFFPDCGVLNGCKDEILNG